MLVEVRVANLGLDSMSNSPVVILQEKDGERILPIWIGPNEYNAIYMELADVKFPRPLTHDLIRQVIIGLGAQLYQVRIVTVQDNTYYAQLELHRDQEVVQIDARPSDSIAIALRLQAPIFTNDDLLSTGSTETVVPFEQPDDTDPESLQNRLRDLNPEDFGKFNL
jgi:hypothetical protein